MTEPSRAIFLSYASQDAEAARRICEALRAGGIEVWFDQSELRGGDAWDQKIRQQIRDCALFIPIISAHTQERLEGYFRREWKMAVDRTHDMAARLAFLLPVVIDHTTDREAEVPDEFRNVQWTRMPDGVTPAAFTERVATLIVAKGTSNHRNPAPRPVDTMSSFARPLVQPKPCPTWIKALLAAIALAALAIGYLGFHRNAPPKPEAQVAQPTPPPNQGDLPAPGAVPEKSIAVLPFVDMSEKHDQDYFSDGLSEELIDRLTRATKLRVISRTSAFYFKGKQTTIAEIAKALRVSHVLEGSVRKFGNAIRITTQLIRVSDETPLWSHTYDRQLKDIFKVQDDIAGTVVRSLQETLGGGSRQEQKPPAIEAYNLALEGNYFANRATDAGYDRAIDLYKRAIGIDPTFALAWTRLAISIGKRAFNSGLPAERASAKDAAQRALQIEPNLAEGHSNLAWILSNLEWDWNGAMAEYDRGLELNPRDAFSRARRAILKAQISGQLGDEVDLNRQAAARDPLSISAQSNLNLVLFDSGQYKEAVDVLRKILQLDPAATSYRGDLGIMLSRLGQHEDALTEISLVPNAHDRLYALSYVYWDMGRHVDADNALKKIVPVAEKVDAFGLAFDLAVVYAYRSDANAAFAWLDRAYKRRDPSLIQIKTDPDLRGLHGDPRYRTLLRKMNLPV